MGYILRTEIMTLAEIKKKSADNYVEEIISVPLQTLLDNDFVGNMDIWEQQLLGDQGILTDVEYDVVGNGINNEVHIKVRGFADLCGEDDPLAIGEQ